ncbi:MAG: hypothetical protein JST94_00600 [Bacteroidetes bacterium]|nr:hypothetical protein [Bacteroidota bacterium]MBS1640915.1 hypothetical protein [Bacteroidota bacterium]MBS1669952.1 hypothetical protein [Bacteroidota bacterium]
MKKNILSYIVLLCCISHYATAQQNNSPYSIIGIGDIEKSYFDRTTGMGYTGIALSSYRYMYTANPAANAALEYHYFNMEVSARFKSVNYAGKPVSSASQTNSSDLQFRKLLLAVKPKSYWATTLGLLPFSTAKYSMYGLKSVQGTPLSTPVYYQGDGGLNNFFLTNSFRIDSNFSVGVQASYLFGHMNETESVLGNVGDSSLTSTRYITISNPYFKFGAQYKTNRKKKWNYAAGITGSYQTKLSADYSLLVTDGNTTLQNDNIYRKSYFTLPVMYGAGVAATLNNKLTFAADYNYEGWSSLNYKGISYGLVNSSKYSLGFEYSKKINFRDVSGNTVASIEKSYFQAGLFYKTSYLRINGYQIDEVGGTIGAGLQVSAFFAVNAALEVGRRGTTDNGLIRENFTQLTVSFSYRDLWRSKKLIRYD